MMTFSPEAIRNGHMIRQSSLTILSALALVMDLVPAQSRDLTLQQLGPIEAPSLSVNGAASIQGNGNISARGLKSEADGSAAFSVNPLWAHRIPDLHVMSYANAIAYKTTRDGDSWESALGIDYVSETGHNEPWVSGKAVRVGDNILGVTGNPEGYVYRVVKAGVLGGASPTAGPKSAPFMNGTAQLQWINFDNLAAKIPFTNTVVVRGDAGKTWLNNFNYSMMPLNNPPKYATNTEWNFYNGSGYHCDLFTGISCGGLTVFQGGPYRSTSIIGMATLANTDTFAAEWGITMKDRKLTRDASIDIATGGKMALGTGRYANVFGTTQYSETVWRDESAAPYAVSLGGSYTQAAIDLQSGKTPVALALAAGQRICFFGNNNCFVKDNKQGKILYQVNGTTVMSIADDGTIRSKGAIIQNTTP